MSPSRPDDVSGRAKKIRVALDAYEQAPTDQARAQAAQTLRDLVLDLPVRQLPAATSVVVKAAPKLPIKPADRDTKRGETMKDLFEADPRTPPSREPEHEPPRASRPRREHQVPHQPTPRAEVVAAPAPRAPKKPKQKVVVADQDDDLEIERLPRLQAAAGTKAVVLVGGIIEKKKLAWIKQHYGFTAEWVETHNALKAVQSVRSRILGGNVAAVVILDGLVSHTHTAPIMSAVRLTETPLAYGDTAGTASLRKAFQQIEGSLK